MLTAMITVNKNLMSNGNRGERGAEQQITTYTYMWNSASVYAYNFILVLIQFRKKSLPWPSLSQRRRCCVARRSAFVCHAVTLCVCPPH